MLGPHLVGLQVFGALRNVEHVDKPGGLVVVDGRVRITTLMSQISWIYPRIVGNIKMYTRDKESSPYPKIIRHVYLMLPALSSALRWVEV